jgi:hypothetical protein
VAVATPNFDETLAQADRGNGVILSGEFGGARVAYLGTDRDLGVIIEIFGGTADDRPQPDETYPCRPAASLPVSTPSRTGPICHKTMLSGVSMPQR